MLTLALVLWLVEPADVGERLKAVQWPWLLLALAITPVQVLLSAWRCATGSACHPRRWPSMES